MVVFPLLIVATTLGYSMVDPEGNLLVQPSWPSSSSSPGSSSSSNSSSRLIFGYGVVLGMGLSSVLSYEIRRRRLWERVRMTIFAWLQESSVLLLAKYRKPTSSDNVEGTFMISPEEGSSPCGIRREVVSPEWCYTSTMNVTILTLYSGSELLAQASPGVEFYYVMRGEGVYQKRQRDEEEILRLSAGTCFVVDPFCIRGFKASGRGDLVLLRASDTISGDGRDVTRGGAGSMSTTAAMLNAGLHKVEALVSNYGSRAQEEKKDDISYV